MSIAMPAWWRRTSLLLEKAAHATHYLDYGAQELTIVEKFLMQLTVNGEKHSVPTAINLIGLIKHFGFEPRKVAIELNLEIVPRSSYEQTLLNDDDRLEIVHFVGGG